MPRPNRKADDTERWASEGGADPTGPATHVPAVEKRNVEPRLEPPTSPNPLGKRRVSHVTHASDAPANAATREDAADPPPGQQEQPQEGVNVEPGEAQPQEMGESG